MNYFKFPSTLLSFVLVVFTVFIFSTSLNAQKSVKELSELPEKKLMKLITAKPSGVSIAVNARQLSWEALPPEIKKIGLLSFFVYTSGNGAGGYYSALTEKGGSMLATMIYDQSFPALNEQLSKSEINLQTPDQYVPSDKLSIYQDSKIELSGAMKFAQGFQNRFEKGETDNESAVADGYTLYTASLMGGRYKTK